MENYLIVTDAASDIIPEYADKWGVKVIPMEIVMTDDTRFDATYDNHEMPLSTFYEKIRSGLFASTTAINIQRYLDYFTPLLKEGNDILYLCFTSGMSSTYNNALMAAEQLREEFPERKLIVVDSLGATGGFGLLGCILAQNRADGMSIEENAKWAEDHRLNINYTWTVADLMHLNRGGRLSKGAALVGTALQIKPIGTIDNDGKLVAINKAHGRKASISKLCAMMSERLSPENKYPVIVCHCDCEKDALALKEAILATGKVSEVLIGRIGPVVGTHLGPGGLTCFYYCDHRSE